MLVVQGLRLSEQRVEERRTQPRHQPRAAHPEAKAADAGEHGCAKPDRGEADEGGPSSERSLPSELWCLGGAWVADEQRSRDSLEPMYKALGTPPPARRLLRGLAITSTLTHDPAKRLVEVSSSRLGAGQPAVFHLDGATRPLWMGRQQGAVRGVELRQSRRSCSRR